MIPSRSRFIFQICFQLTVGVLLTLCAVAAQAQSGRRSTKPPATPGVPLVVEAKPPEKKPATSDLPKIKLIVGTSRNDVFAGVPLYIYDSVLKSCTGRLDDSHGVSVQAEMKGMARGEAVTRAKAATDGYVIWLQLRGDDMSRGYAGNLDQIYLEYTVFEATTAKVKTQGSCYQSLNRKGGVVLSPRTSGSNTVIVEARLKDAAEDAAQRILKALHIASPSDIPPH
jgi:hypothetical protein